MSFFILNSLKTVGIFIDSKIKKLKQKSKSLKRVAKHILEDMLFVLIVFAKVCMKRKNTHIYKSGRHNKSDNECVKCPVGTKIARKMLQSGNDARNRKEKRES